MKIKLSLILAVIMLFLTACSQIQTTPSPVPGSVGTAKEVPKRVPKSKKYELPSLGCKLTLTDDLKRDDSYQPYYIRFSNDEFDLKISKERSPYEDMDHYFNRYIYKYLLNETFQRVNGMKLIEHKNTTINGYKTKIVVLSRDATDEAAKDYYYQAIISTGERYFYMLNFKTSKPEVYQAVIDKALKSFGTIKSEAKSFSLKFKPNTTGLGGETLDYYNKIKASTGVQWGIFYPASLKPFEKFKEIEQKIDYTFPVMLHYIYLGHEFPIDTLEKAHKSGKTVELTLQTMWSVKEKDTADNKDRLHSTVYDIIDGEYDDYLREFARGLKEFGHPVLFRLDNEMNGTWTLYIWIVVH